MKAYTSPELELIRFRAENVLTYSIPGSGDEPETPVIPFKLPQVDVGQ